MLLLRLPLLILLICLSFQSTITAFVVAPRFDVTKKNYENIILLLLSHYPNNINSFSLRHGCSTRLASQQQAQLQQQDVDSTKSIQKTTNNDDNNENDNNDDTSSSSSSSSPVIVFPGGGIFFFWQAGAASYLQEQQSKKYNDDYLSSCSFVGASAGALTATLTCCNANFYKATERALSMSKDAHVWDRPLGLQGIWGPMIETWLYEFIPDDISLSSINNRLHLLITPVPKVWEKEMISTFSNRDELIQCGLCSVHLPWFLDGNLVSSFRNKPYMDGSFLANSNDYYLKCQNNSNQQQQQKEKLLILDWKQDPTLQHKRGLDIVETMSPDGIWNLFELGRKHAQKMEANGQFQCFEKRN